MLLPLEDIALTELSTYEQQACSPRSAGLSRRSNLCDRIDTGSGMNKIKSA
jgi:hypothetical protein